MLNYFGRGERKVARPGGAMRSETHPGWPESTPYVTLNDGGRVRLRPLMHTDATEWRQMRLLDEPYLRPVEPTIATTWEDAHSLAAWQGHFSYLRAAAQQGNVVPLVVEVDGDFAGQVTLGNIQRGSVSECWIGYWVFSALQGRGVGTAACALGVDHAFARVGLHRVSATFLPSNAHSGRVLTNTGFVQEGMLRRNLHIDGRWQDHAFMAIVVDDFAETAVERLRAQGKLR